MTAPEITATELKARLDDGSDCLVIDIREEWERDIAPFPGARVVPFDELPGALADEPHEREMVTICHHGGRSFTAAMPPSGPRTTSLASITGVVPVTTNMRPPGFSIDSKRGS